MKIGFGCQVSAPPPAKKTAGQIKKETPARQMSIDECRIKEFFLFYLLKEQSEATSTNIHSSFVIRQFRLVRIRIL